MWFIPTTKYGVHTPIDTRMYPCAYVYASQSAAIRWKVLWSYLRLKPDRRLPLLYTTTSYYLILTNGKDNEGALELCYGEDQGAAYADLARLQGGL